MMNEQTINEQYAHVRTLLEQERLKEALTQLEALLWQCPEWELRTDVERQQTSYKYMLDYMKQGVKDPERWKLRKKLLSDTWSIADRWRIFMLDNLSASYYHTLRRTFGTSEMARYGLKQILHALESFNDSMEASASDEETQKVLDQHESMLKAMFIRTWINNCWSAEDEEDAQAMLTSEQLISEDLSLFVSAVTLSVMECFDARKVQWLLDAYLYPELNVNQRALVGIMILFHIYRIRLRYESKIQSQLSMMLEELSVQGNVVSIYRQMLLCQETEKIDKKMREEIIPEVLRNVPLEGLKLRLDENEEESNDQNPDWEFNFEKAGLSDKLREMNELQLEGADVYMSTFSQLKNFPFFRELYNWFYPFTKRQSDVFKAMQHQGNESNRTIDLVLQTGFFGNNDKYSFFFTIYQLPAMQRNLAMGQFSEQLEAQKEDKASNETLRKYNERPDTISNQYLHDLYRFFKLNMHRKEFRDIFTERLDLYHTPVFDKILGNPSVMFPLADFYVRKERWDEAIGIYQEMETRNGFTINGNGVDNYQKYGYALQKKKQYAAAIDAYRKADTLKPDTLWTNRHLATCFRLSRRFQEALTCYRKVEEITPDNASIVYYIACCMTELERYDEALNAFFKLDLMENDSLRAWRGIGWCSFVTGKYEQAQKYYNKIIAQKPTKADYLNAGHVAWVTGDIPSATSFYEKSIAICGNREEFLQMFRKDEKFLSEKVEKEDIPLMLDLI